MGRLGKGRGARGGAGGVAHGVNVTHRAHADHRGGVLPGDAGAGPRGVRVRPGCQGTRGGQDGNGRGCGQ